MLAEILNQKVLEAGVIEAKDEWFYIKGRELNGPVTFPLLKSRYKSGYLDERTLVWTASMRFGKLQLYGEHARQSATQTSTEVAPFSRDIVLLHCD
jgi:hypothetical protein